MKDVIPELPSPECSRRYHRTIGGALKRIGDPEHHIYVKYKRGDLRGGGAPNSLNSKSEVCLRTGFELMDPRIKFALQIMGHTTADELTVAHVAHEVGLSPSRFEHILKETTGRTFRQHKQRMRIRRAKKLLQDWHLSLKQIAYLTGYSSPSSFSRAFRNSVCRSPSQHRKNADVKQCHPDPSRSRTETADSAKGFL